MRLAEKNFILEGFINVILTRLHHLRSVLGRTANLKYVQEMLHWIPFAEQIKFTLAKLCADMCRPSTDLVINAE